MSESANNESRQFVIFKIGKDQYGADIQHVSIIERIGTVTRVPRTPNYIKGVINLRGDIIPIVDLATRFGLTLSPDTDDTRIVITLIDDSPVGIKVDAVEEVIQFEEDAIESSDSISREIDEEYVIGIGKHDNNIITLLDFEKLVKSIDISIHE